MNLVRKLVPAVVASLLTVGALTLSSAQAPVRNAGGPTGASNAMAGLIDINSASKADLSALPGIGDVYSDKIIAGRPYHAKTDLKTRGVIPTATYNKISSMIVARRPTSK